MREAGVQYRGARDLAQVRGAQLPHLQGHRAPSAADSLLLTVPRVIVKEALQTRCVTVAPRARSGTPGVCCTSLEAYSAQLQVCGHAQHGHSDNIGYSSARGFMAYF